jgi:hypothetical protein
MSDTRPVNCRFRLQDEGKAYPRSSCPSCGATVTSGLGTHCSKGVYQPTTDAGEGEAPTPKKDAPKKDIALRDWFAGQALAGFCANPDLNGYAAKIGLTPDGVQKAYADSAYAQADAMIAERSK